MIIFGTTVIVSVLSTSNMHCSEPTFLDSTAGYISSFEARKKCGNRKTSWEIKSSPGQQVNVTLTDFGYGKEDDKKRCFG